MIDYNMADHLQVAVLIAIASLTADPSAAGVDLNDYTGELAILLSAKNTAGTTPTLDCKLQHSNDNGSSDAYADVPSAAFTQSTTGTSDQKMVVQKSAVKRYVRAVLTFGGTSTPTYLASVKLLAVKKYSA